MRRATAADARGAEGSKPSLPELQPEIASADSVEFQVSGAGGLGACTDGLYRQAGMHNDCPMYAQVDGSAVIYFSERWKINFQNDLKGWLYSAPSWEQPQPPSGLWTTSGYAFADADPAPSVTVLRSTPADAFSSSPMVRQPEPSVDGPDGASRAEDLSAMISLLPEDRRRSQCASLPEELEVCAPLSPTWSAAASTSICDADVARALRSLPNQKVALQLVQSLGRFSENVSSLRGRHAEQRQQTERLQKTLWPQERLDMHLTALQAENSHLTDWCMVRPSVLPAAKRTIEPQPRREAVTPQGLFRDLLEQEAMMQEDLASEKYRRWCPMPLSRPGHICEDFCVRLYEREQELRAVLEEEQRLLGDCAIGMVRTTSDVRLRFEKDIAEKNRAQRSGVRSHDSPSKVSMSKVRGRNTTSQAA